MPEDLMAPPRLRVFIGSSTEGLRVAEALQELLDAEYEVRLWTHDVFELSQGVLESLLRCVDQIDLAILVLTADDVIASRGDVSCAPRDNVVFELGLFIGGLGRARTFFVFDQTAETKVPSDLAGINAATYVPPSSGTMVSALGAAASKIRRAAERIASRQVIAPVQTNSGCSISVHFGRLEEVAAKDEQSLVLLPANEFFDDECVADTRSALGAFIAAHCRSGPSGFQSRMKATLSARSSVVVEKEHGVNAASYGAGATIFLRRSEELPFNIAAAAVTTKRAGQGLNGSPENILRALSSVIEVAADNRLSRLWLPLLCSGHGGVTAAVSLQTILIGLADSCRRAGGHHLRECGLVVFRRGPRDAPELPVDAVRMLVSNAREWIGQPGGAS